MTQPAVQPATPKNRPTRPKPINTQLSAAVWEQIQRAAKKRGLNEEQFITLLLTDYERPKLLTAGEVRRLPKRERERILKAAVHHVAGEYADDDVVADNQNLVEY